MNHDSGYERKSIKSVRLVWKIVEIHRIRSPHAPSIDTIMGVMDIPIPR